jgi:DNA-3-methyladenine glycosylase II
MWTKAEKALKKDEYIGPLIGKYGSCTIVPSKEEDYFEDLVDAIIQQQLSIRAAKSIFEKARVGLGGEVTPERILETGKSKFRKWGLSNQKIEYIKDLAEKVGREEVDIKELSFLPDEEVMSQLTSVKGIGEWTSHMFLMFSLARPDIFPVGDLGIRKGVTKLFEKDLEIEEMVAFSKRWSPFRTPASWYIWSFLENA